MLYLAHDIAPLWMPPSVFLVSILFSLPPSSARIFTASRHSLHFGLLLPVASLCSPSVGCSAPLTTLCVARTASVLLDSMHTTYLFCLPILSTIGITSLTASANMQICSVFQRCLILCALICQLIEFHSDCLSVCLHRGCPLCIRDVHHLYQIHLTQPWLPT